MNVALRYEPSEKSLENQNLNNKNRLHKIICERSLMRGDFQLSSGRQSTYLFQLRQTTMHPEGATLIGNLILESMEKWGIKCVGGLELGAVPIVAALAPLSYLKGYNVDLFFVRKQAKAHGARELIDGYINPGAEVLIVDDVTTTGGSILKAIDALRSMHQCKIRRALSVVDREEGAVENMEKNGIELVSIFQKRDFL